MMKNKTKASYRFFFFFYSSYSPVIPSIEILLQLKIFKNITHHPWLFLGGFSGPAKKIQRKRPEKRAAGEAAERIPAGPRHRWHQADISTEAGGGDKRKTRVCPLLSSSLPLVSILLSSHLLLSSPLLSFSSPPPPPSFTCKSSTPTPRSSVWVAFCFFFPSLPLARPLCA